jgi:Fe-S cluster biosynthesis and repair protein YggX
MDTNQRIMQWEKMTQADPENSMGWFSLGNAYKDAQRPEDAAAAFKYAIDLDAGLSRAYQLLGQVLIQLGRNEEAGKILADGYRTAAQRGDVMPQRAMGSLLEKLGKPVPAVETQAAPAVALDDKNAIIDRRTGKPGQRLPDPPMRGAVGQLIYENFSQETWREWIGMGTKVINELRLDFSNLEHQRVYEQHMLEWLGITPEEIQQYAQKLKNNG